MTSVSQQPQNTASNSSNASQAAQSYASATKKTVSSPAIATSSSNTTSAVAVEGTAPVQQHGKSSSISPVNGRAAITPAVPAFNTPAIAHSNGTNGSSADHSRKASVTIGANGGYIPNGGPVGGPKAGGIQFGSITDSPAASHSTPQIAQTSAPIAIPSNPRVTSPAQSPSPIPQPIASGGRPPSGLQGNNGMTFGSLGADGDRHMRQASGSQGPPGSQGSHSRRESSGEMSHQGGGSTRGGYQSGRGGRGGNNFNNNNNSGGFQPQQMQYPQGGPQYRGPANAGRGGMAPSFQSQARPPMGYPNSPHQAARSPALTHSIPGTPNMGQAMPMQSPQQQYGQYQPYQMPPQVHNPSSFPNSSGSTKSNRSGGGKKLHNKSGQPKDTKPKQKSFEQREQPRELFGHTFSPNKEEQPDGSQRSLSSEQTFIPPTLPLTFHPRVSGASKMDFSPASGNFDQYLTNRQNFQGYPQQRFDPMTGFPMGMQGNQFMQYPVAQYMQGMQGPPQSPQPGYQQPYIPGQYNNQAQPQQMSRSSSQMSERPNSSLGPQTPAAAPATAHTPQTKPAVASSNAFQRPTRKSAAIVIRNPDGDVVNLPVSKPPASPAPSNRSSTPIIASTPTPPPKPATPSHARTDSSAAVVPGKSSTEVINEFKEKMRKAAELDKASDAKKEEEAAAAKLAEETKVKEEAKAKEEARIAEEARVAKEAADKEAADKLAAEEAAAKAKQAEEEEFEKMVKEMEEADARREKEEAERLAKRNAEKAAAKKIEEEKQKAAAEENDRKLREQEREMERLEDERERKRLAGESSAVDVKTLLSQDPSKAIEAKEEKAGPATPSTLASKLSNLTLGTDSGASTPASDDSMGPPPKILGGEKRGKPAALNLAPLNTKPIEPPQPSAALQSLKSARFLTVLNSSLYPPNISSPNPALNSAVTTKGKSFKYDKEFLMQFQKVFTEKPSMEFESQIKALIGDSEPGSARSGSQRGTGSLGPRQGSNRNAPGAFAMGNFGAVNSGKTLPPGTTSADRFAMSQGTLPRPNAPNPMASFTRAGGAFPSTGSLNRSASSQNIGGPNSPRNSSNRNNTRNQNQSKRDNFKGSKEDEKKMPLTAGMDLKPIQVTSSGWKPRSLQAQSSATGAAGPAPGSSGAGGHMEPDMVQRKVKAALNKMTPEKFDKIADQILAIAAQSKDEADGRTLRQVIQLTFEKATDEAYWASMYAKFCKRMLETMSSDIKDESITDKNGNVVSGGNLFRKYLLNRCQEEFERGWKMDLGDKPEGDENENEAKTEEAAMLSDAYYIAAAAKRRGLGLVQFIGELYKLGMLTERIMHECVKKLVDYTGIPDEAEIESLTKLLKTIGGNLDSTEKGKPMMDVYFGRIQSMIDTPDLPSRLRFMLMDIVDLRKKRWVSKEDNKGPKTLEEVRAEAEAAQAQKAAENSRSTRGGGGGGGGGRMPMGRGDSRNFSGQYGNQPPVDYSKNTVATDDLRRLGNKGSNRQNAPMSFGPTSLFSSRSNSGRKMGPGGSLSRNGEDSGASSRTGTPPQQKEKDSTTSVNAFSLLGDLNDSGEHETPASPPSAAASPALSKAAPSSAEKESES